MTLKRIVIGTLGLLMALVWSMALVYQRHNLDLLGAMLVAASPVYPVKVSSLWSLLQLGATGLLTLPVVGASIAALLGARSALRVLRAVTGLSAVLSLGTLLIYATMIVPIVFAGGPLLPFGPGINYELLAAACALGIQIVILALLKRSGIDDTDGVVNPRLTTDGGQMPNTALQPTRRDPQLTALPSSAITSRLSAERQAAS